MNPEPALTALKLPLEGTEGETYDSVCASIQDVVKDIDSATLDHLMNEEYKQAGTIAWSTDEFKASEHGKANAHVGLYELFREDGSKQPASWWPEQPSMPSSPQRPLAGLKVVDLTRVIAAPTITRGLAEMGASVMRVTSPNVTDHFCLHQDLGWGKWNCSLDLKKDPEDRQALAALIRDADVVVEGYRPGAMKRNGFGREEIFDLVKDRDRGIIHVRENCYGWNGPWQHRSGWQQISDAVSRDQTMNCEIMLMKTSAAASHSPTGRPWATTKPSLRSFQTQIIAQASPAARPSSTRSPAAPSPAAPTLSTPA